MPHKCRYATTPLQDSEYAPKKINVKKLVDDNNAISMTNFK